MSKRDWLEAGLALLADQGAPAVTIERLTERLGVSKGSFYHHFKGMGGFKTALLEHFQSGHTGQIIQALEQDGSASARVKLERLLDLVLTSEARPALEIAMRAWALQDDEVRAVQEVVDAARIDYVRSLWLGMGGDPAEAGQMARLLYLVIVGGGHLVPPIPPGELHGIYDLIMRLAPGEPPAATG